MMSSDRRDDRQRDRGRDRGRPQDTNKGDAKSIRCRIFIGNLNTDNLSRQELEEVFSKHGHVVGCSLHNGFGFVQYEKESEADEAVKKQHGTIIKERRVDVNLAGDRRKPDDKEKRPGSSFRGRPAGLDRPRDRSPSPGRRGINDPLGAPGYREGRDRFRDDPYFKDPLDRPDRGPLGSPLKRSPYGPPRDVYKKPDDHLRPDPYSRPPMDDIPPKRTKMDYDFPPDSREPLPAHNRPVGTPIDCEVIIINKQQRGYADMVEKKLKVHGLVVECAHLPETVTLLAELEDASRRGVLYGIIISSQHEVHHSVTVHILHGTQQEHRNMPLEDAINLVSRNFEQYMQNLRERERDREQERPAVAEEPLEAPKGYGAGNPAPDPIAPIPYTPEISQLLNMAADGKYLTSNQCTLLVNEFTRLRDELLKKEGRPAPTPAASAPKPFPTDPQSIALQQAELQAKILSILNPGAKSSNGVKPATQGGANSVTAQNSQVNVPAGAEGKATSKIPVLTPSFGAASAFQAFPSSSSGQAATSQPRASGGAGASSQYANQILGMAFSNMRGGGAAPSPSTNQLQGSVSYAPGSQSPYSRDAGAASAVARSVTSPARSQAQLRAPSGTGVTRPAMEAGSGVNNYRGRGHYSGPQNTGYRPAVPSGYPKRH